MNRVEVRRRAAADLPALAAVLRRVHAHDGYPVEGVANAEAWLSPPDQLAAWTALLDGVPVAQIAVGAADPTDEIGRTWSRVTGLAPDRLIVPARLFVDPAARAYGIGGLLMDEVRQYATDAGRPVAFDVMLKDHAAIRLYERAGCVRLAEFTYAHSDGQVERAAIYAVPERPE